SSVFNDFIVGGEGGIRPPSRLPPSCYGGQDAATADLIVSVSQPSRVWGVSLAGLPNVARSQVRRAKVGGEGGIRTHVPVTRQHAFEARPLRPLRYLSVEGNQLKRTFHYTNGSPEGLRDERRKQGGRS